MHQGITELCFEKKIMRKLDLNHDQMYVRDMRDV